jgi:hypothetical protein
MIRIFICFINVAFGTIVISNLCKKVVTIEICDQFTYNVCSFRNYQEMRKNRRLIYLKVPFNKISLSKFS